MTPSEPLAEQRYTIEELVELRRINLRYARSFSAGDERNRHRQVAASLHLLFKRKSWLQAHVRNKC